MRKMTDDSSAARAERMAKRNRATITVDLIRVEAKLCDDRQYLAGECLIDFPQIDLRGR